MSTSDGNAAMRVFYLAMGVLHDRRFLLKFAERKLDATYAYILSTGRPFEVPGVHSRHLGYTTQHGDGAWVSMKRIINKFPAFVRFQTLLRKMQPDVLHATWIPVVGFWAALSGYRPLVVSVYGTDVRVRAFREPRTRAIVRFVLRRADAIVCDCEYSRDKADELVVGCGSKSVVFPWGIELDRYRPDPVRREEERRKLGWAPGERWVLVARRFDRIYHVDEAIRAFHRLSREVENVRLALLGEGPLEVNLKALVGQLGLEHRVMFLKDLPHDEMPSIFNAADAYLNFSEQDGSSLAMMEALSCGLPVVTAEIPSTVEWIQSGRNGVLFPLGDVAGAAKILEKIFTEEALAKRLAREAWATARARADWDRNFDVLERCYRDLIGRKARLEVPGDALGRGTGRQTAEA